MSETPSKSTKAKNQVVLLKAKIAEALDLTKKEFAEILNSAASYVDGLTDDEIREVVSDKAVKPALKALGLQVVDLAQPTITIKPNAKRTRRSKVSDEDILKFLATERNTGEVREKLGQLVPKRLVGLEKAGKISQRQDGLKKLWKAK